MMQSVVGLARSFAVGSKKNGFGDAINRLSLTGESDLMCDSPGP